jgi:hypothetical protein
METVATKPFITSSHTIPLDVFMDVVRILLDNAFNWHVEGINEKENSLLIQVSIQHGSAQHRKALENIQGFLSDYGYYLKGSPSSEPE